MYSGIKNKRGLPWAVVMIVGLAVSASAQMITGTDSGLGGTNSITGTVLSPAGQRADRHISVRLSTPTRGDRVAVTDDSGNFAFRGLTNGDYILVIDKEKEFEPHTQTVTVLQMRGTPGQNFMLSIRLKYKKGTDVKPAVINAELAGIPGNAVSHYKKAAEFAKAGDNKGAIEQLNNVIKAHPKFALAYNDLGVQYLKLNDLGRADDAFQSAINLDSKLFAPQLNHGIALFNMKLYSKAETVFRDALKIKEESAVAHYFLGQSLADQGKFDEAEKELNVAVKTGGPEMKEAHRILAIIYSSKGDKARAAAALETYLQLAPDAPDAEQLRATLKKLKGT